MRTQYIGGDCAADVYLQCPKESWQSLLTSALFCQRAMKSHRMYVIQNYYVSQDSSAEDINEEFVEKHTRLFCIKLKEGQ